MSESKGPNSSIFDFRKHEAPVAVTLSFFFFAFIFVFQILRPLKKGLFVGALGADVELHAKLLNILISAAGVVAFTYLANKLQRQRLLYLLCFFFAASFAALGICLKTPQTWSVWTFYLLGDFLTTIMVSAFWAYASDISTPDQAKRLYGIVGVGGVIGGWGGAAVSKMMLEKIGTTGLLFVAASLMALLPGLVRLIESQIQQSRAFGSDTRSLDEKRKEQPSASVAVEGARLAFQSKYLAAVVGLMAFYEIGSQVNDYEFSKFSESLKGVLDTQIFMTNIAFYANSVAVVVQLFFVSLIMKKWGLTPALLVLPIALLLSSLGFFASPGLMMAGLLFISDNGLNYSIQQTSRETLYVVTTPEEKYKARAFTNMVVQRAAKGLAIFAVMGLGMAGITGPSFRYLSLITAAVMIVMMILSIYAGRVFARKSEGVEVPEAPKQETFFPTGVLARRTR